MEESQIYERSHSSHQSDEKLPAHATSSPLEVVIEEDENPTWSPGASRQQIYKEENNDDADDEMINDKASPSYRDFSSKSRRDSGIKKTHSRSRIETSAKIHSAHKVLSRAGSHKSRQFGKDSDGSKNVGQGSDSDSDIEDSHLLDNRSDLDIWAGSLNNEKDWDTDLEAEEPSVSYDHSGKTSYMEACKKFEVVSASYFLRHMNSSRLSMRHHGLTGNEMKAIAASLISNTTITTLDLTDNWLGYEGGMAVSEMLRENCFITDLNLSDNHLYLCAHHLCHIIEHNDTLHRVNLSGNGFDDKSAVHIADLIMNSTKLEYLNLSHNNLGEKAGLLLGPAISENLCLKELDLSWNHLRRKGAMAVAAGIKNNVFMKRINMSWNGFGLEGSVVLMDALKANNVLEELDVTNNRITTEGAVYIGKGITVNETLKIIKMGKNPMQSAGCWAIAAAILKNPNCILELLDFSDILVNKDFEDLWKQIEERFPNMKIKHGGMELPLKPKTKPHPMAKLASHIASHNIKLMKFFKDLDKGGNLNVTKQEFRQGLGETNLKLTGDEIEAILEQMNVNENGEINYSELARGCSEFQEEKNKLSTLTILRPMTS